MADEIKKEPKKGLSNTVKLILAAVVLLIAFFFISSIGRNNGSVQTTTSQTFDMDAVVAEFGAKFQAWINQNGLTVTNLTATNFKSTTSDLGETTTGNLTVNGCLKSGCQAAPAPLVPKKYSACTNDCTVWNATRNCADGGKQYCGNYSNTDNCLHWSGCIKTEKPYIGQVRQICQGKNIVWIDSNGNYSGTVQICQNTTETKCFGKDLKERTIYAKCVGDPYCARDGESGWRTIKNCSPECGCYPRREERRVIERVVERVIEKETIVNNNVNNNINNNVINVPAPVVETPTVIATPPAPVAAPKVACTQNCPAVEIEKTSLAVAIVPAAAAAPVVVCTQNCTPKDVEGAAGTPVPAPVPVPTPTPAPVTTGNSWSPD